MHDRPMHEPRRAAVPTVLGERGLEMPLPGRDPGVFDAAVAAFRRREPHADDTTLQLVAIMEIFALAGLRSSEIAALLLEACAPADDGLNVADPADVRVTASGKKPEPARRRRREGVRR